MASLAGSASSSPVILLLLVAAALAAGASAFPLTITNRCPFTVWPALVPEGGSIELRPGGNWNLDVPEITGGTIIWGRTGSSFDKTGRGRCKTGDDPNVAVTKAEVSVFEGSYHYGITTYNGFNLPLDFACSSGDALRCRKARCRVAYPREKYYQHKCSAAGSGKKFYETRSQVRM